MKFAMILVKSQSNYNVRYAGFIQCVGVFYAVSSDVRCLIDNQRQLKYSVLKYVDRKLSKSRLSKYTYFNNIQEQETQQPVRLGCTQIIHNQCMNQQLSFRVLLPHQFKTYEPTCINFVIVIVIVGCESLESSLCMYVGAPNRQSTCLHLLQLQGLSCFEFVTLSKT